uniref:Uncharacterized protein n=1 Tax=Ditylenchus dipsaci TaxID=166011 RepID=A0A915DKK0_9BILA
MHNQRGFGVLSSIGKFLLPIVKNLAVSVGEEGVNTGINVLNDLAKGKDLKESVKSHGRDGLTKLAAKVQQCGKGKKRLKKPKIFKDPFSNLV